ncbi:MAG: hypothetical protein JWM98_2074 [Thermoleophilia bacterium]|nr:hypothetical protein [Thermoleophilia bacterium]
MGQFTCCICYRDTADNVDYIELALQVPDKSALTWEHGCDNQRVGAHASCIRPYFAPGVWALDVVDVDKVEIRMRDGAGVGGTLLVRAMPEGDGIWRILDDEGHEEWWEHAAGDRVHCQLENGKLVVAGSAG